MHNLKTTLIILITFLSLTAYCQEENSFYAEVVVIEDLNLIKTIDSLIIDNKCINERADLYIDYKKNDYMTLGQGAISQYIRLFKNDNTKVYMTFINNNPFFIFSDNDRKLPIRKTEFKLDLSEFLDVYDYSIRDYSYWILKEQGEKIEIVKEVLFGCN